MRSPDEVYDNVWTLINTEMGAIVSYRKTKSSESSWIMAEVRLGLLPLLQEATGLKDISLLLRIERAFMTLELEQIAYDPDNINSLRMGIRQVDAAAIMLDCVRDPVEYRRVHFYYNLSQDLLDKSDLPRDAAHKFFGSHKAKLLNSKKGQNDPEKSALLKARISYIRQAKKDYMELQRQALAVPEVREQVPPAAEVREAAGQYTLSAVRQAVPVPSAIREAARQYILPQDREPARQHTLESKHRLAA